MMNTQAALIQDKASTSANDHRARLLSAIPATERHLNLNGVPTAVLVGGEGPPIILLHGPGESSTWWMRVVPKLIKTHRVIVPDLPGHGATWVNDKTLDKESVFQWLDELIEQTCPTPPTLVGHLLGASLAARFAIGHGSRLGTLVLVNSFGLGKFRPPARFAFGLIRFMIWPTRKNYNRFLPQCVYDPDDLRSKMGPLWEPFIAYNIECAKDSDHKAAMRFLMKEVGVPEIPSEDLARISVPTALIWGRHDLVNDLQVAEAASNRYGWPLHVIEEARDDPKLERPDAVVRALYHIMKRAEPVS